MRCTNCSPQCTSCILRQRHQRALFYARCLISDCTLTALCTCLHLVVYPIWEQLRICSKYIVISNVSFPARNLPQRNFSSPNELWSSLISNSCWTTTVCCHSQPSWLVRHLSKYMSTWWWTLFYRNLEKNLNFGWGRTYSLYLIIIYVEPVFKKQDFFSLKSAGDLPLLFTAS